MITCSPSSNVSQMFSPLCSFLTAQPFIRMSPGNVTVNQTNEAMMMCMAQGNPLPNITWTGPSTDFTTSDSFGANFTVTSTLFISSANRSQHEGEYVCTAENGIGQVVIEDNFASGHLIVQGTLCDLSCKCVFQDLLLCVTSTCM